MNIIIGKRNNTIKGKANGAYSFISLTMGLNPLFSVPLQALLSGKIFFDTA
jgi:hypothetical protein